MAVLVALALVSTGPALAWQAGGGDAEPSTSYDTKGYMHQEANTDAVEKVYLNAFRVDGYVPTFDPNVEGGSLTSHLFQIAAFLGFWRDCNGDGYVGAKSVPELYASNYGHFSQGAYPVDHSDPDTTNLCPVTSPYNNGMFIDEFRWIGPKATPSQGELDRGERLPCDPAVPFTIIEDCLKTWKDRHDVTDANAKIWTDLSEPESEAAVTRPVLARETFDDSDNTLDLVGFYGLHDTVEEESDGQIPASMLWNDKPNFGDCGDAGYREREFGGGPNVTAWGTDTGVQTCGYYPLWQANRLVNDSEHEDDFAEPVVYVFDTENDDGGDPESDSPCDDQPLPGGFATADPHIPPETQDDPLMNGSLGGTVYGNVLAATGKNTHAGSFDGECGEGSPDQVLYGTSAAPGKYRVDTWLSFYPQQDRFRSLRGEGVDDVPMDAGGLTGGPISPIGATGWFSAHVYIRAGAHNTLQNVTWMTTYADVSPQTFANAKEGATPATALPAKSQDAYTYGGTECATTDDTPENRQTNDYGWLCSETLWKEEQAAANEDRDADGVDTRLRVIVHADYDLRDADCYDDTVAKGLGTGDVVVDGTGAEGLDGTQVRLTCEPYGLLAPEPEQ